MTPKRASRFFAGLSATKTPSTTRAHSTNLPDYPQITRSASSPGATHLARLEKDFMQASQSLNLEFLAALPRDRDLRVEASPYVVSYAAQVDGKLHVFLSNFAGIVPHKNVRPT